MKITFANERARNLAGAAGRPLLSAAAAAAIEWKLQFLAAAADERSLRNWRSLGVQFMERGPSSCNVSIPLDENCSIRATIHYADTTSITIDDVVGARLRSVS